MSKKNAPARVLFASLPWDYDGMRPAFQYTPNSLVQWLTGDSGTWVGISPPLGLMYLSSVLRLDRVETRFLDGFTYSLEDFVRVIEQWRPDVLAIQLHAKNWIRDRTSITRLRERFPHLTIVAGGAHARRMGARLLVECPALDVVIPGEGELLITELVRRAATREPLAGMRGIIARTADGPVDGGVLPGVRDLDTLPFPDYSLIDLADYIPTQNRFHLLPCSSVIDSRGCAFNCTFCDSAKDFRWRSPENIVEELRWLREQYGVRDIMFFSNVFTVPRNNAQAICEAMIDAKLDMVWHANVRANVVDRDILRLMREAGCRTVYFGIESGSQSVLDDVGKGITLDQVREAVGHASGAGLEVLGFFMIGFPGETAEDVAETVRFAKTLDLDYANFTPLSFYHATDEFEGLEDGPSLVLGELTDERRNELDIMTGEDLNRLERRSLRSFFMRPEYVLHRITRTRDLCDVKKNVTGLSCLINSFLMKGERDIT